jgi:hypothetical protein
MTYAKKTAAALIDEASAAMGLFEPPARAFFRELLDATLNRLYTDVIEERTVAAYSLTDGGIALSAIVSPTGAPVREEDLCAVWLDGKGARYLSPAAAEALGALTTPCYTVRDGVILPLCHAEEVRVCYLLRPAPCTEENEGDYRIPLGDEFVPILFARLCGEGYKRAGEDELAAKWLADYNHLLADFAAVAAAARARREG